MAKVIAFPKRGTSANQLAGSGLAPGASSISELLSIPIIRHAMFVLEGASSDKGLKLTQTGALKREFVQAFWDEFLAEEDVSFRPNREADCRELERIHQILLHSEFMRRTKSWSRLTKSGRRVLDQGASLEVYRELLFAGIQGWNWAYEDRYPDFEFIQESAHEMIEHLWNWPSPSLTAVEFAEDIFRKVDADGEPVQMPYDENAPIGLDTYEGLVRCLHLRFFQRFCIPFGLLRCPSLQRFRTDPQDRFEKTDFFLTDFPKLFGR